VRDADQKSVRQIVVEAKTLIAKARAGRLVPSEFTGGTFTISNLGMYGIEQFTAIINPPEAALLAVGATTPRIVVHQGAVSVRQCSTVALGIDYRAVDGATGARFLEPPVNLLHDSLRILA
jgi:pyruvate dehydrogenase E2 component (dihydrolipoamide acetyltransferase)